MDWGKAKTILIVSFLCLNLFLGYQLWEEQKKQGIQGQISQLQIDELKQKLIDSGIQFTEDGLDEEMPEMSNMKVLVKPLNEQPFDGQVERINWENRELEVVFKQAIPILENSTEQDRASLYQTQIALFDQYQYDETLSKGGPPIYTQRINGYPVFSSQLHIQLTEQGWVGYKQTYLVQEEKGVSRQIVSAYTALAVLLEHGQIEAGEAIGQVQLGYTMEQLDANVQFLVPAWRVVHTNGIHYINGFTGMVIGASKN